MLFTEPAFLFVFLPILLALYQVPGSRYRNWLLLTASIIFYTRGAGSFRLTGNSFHGLTTDTTNTQTCAYRNNSSTDTCTHKCKSSSQ